MLRYLKIIWQFSKMSITSQTEYRPSFVLAVIGKILYLLIFVYFFWAIYAQVPEIAGWNLYELLFLFSIFSIVSFIISFFFLRNLMYNFEWQIYYGDFDMFLTKPINPLIYASFNIMDIMDLTSGIGAVAILIYSISKLSVIWSASSIILGIILIIFAVLFIYALTVLVTSTFFYTITGRGLGDAINNIIGLGKFPTTMYQGYLQPILTFAFPIIIIATLPAQTFLGQINLNLIFYVIIFTSVLLIIAIKVWFWALKHYSSASS